MKPKLHQFYYSPYCAKVSKILEYKGFEYEVHEVDYLKRDELLAASGQLQVPALQLDNETIVGSTPIALRLEELRQSPSIFPPGSRGLHLVLTRYFDEQLEDALFRVALPDITAYQRRQGADHEALFRLIRERKYGPGFCERMERERETNAERMERELEPLEDALADRGFILGRIGLADFALYGQLWFLAFSGELKIPARFTNLRAFFDRMNRISASPEQAAP